MDIIIALIVGVIIGFKVNELLQVWAFQRILKELGITEQQMRELARKNGIIREDPPEDSELPELEVKIEQHQGILFAFRKDTDQFLGQGTDREQLIESLKANLTNVRVIIAQEDGAELLQKNNT